MQRLKSIKIHVSEIVPDHLRSQFSETEIALKIQERFSHLNHPLVIAVSQDWAVVEYPE